jgi:hypothetical protein
MSQPETGARPQKPRPLLLRVAIGATAFALFCALAVGVLWRAGLPILLEDQFLAENKSTNEVAGLQATVEEQRWKGDRLEVTYRLNWKSKREQNCFGWEDPVCVFWDELAKPVGSARFPSVPEDFAVGYSVQVLRLRRTFQVPAGARCVSVWCLVTEPGGRVWLRLETKMVEIPKKV